MTDVLYDLYSALRGSSRIVTYVCSKGHPTRIAGDYQDDDIAALYCSCGSLICDAYETGNEAEEDV
jgi:hypothetical protein